MQIFSESSVNLQWIEKSLAGRFGGAEHVWANRPLVSSFFILSAAAVKEQQRRAASASITGQSAHSSSLTFARHTGNVSTWNRVLRANTAPTTTSTTTTAAAAAAGGRNREDGEWKQ